jgi:hypothetical protein
MNTLLAQVKDLDLALPSLQGDVPTGMTWVIIGVLAAGILLVAFKSHGRSHLD